MSKLNESNVYWAQHMLNVYWPQCVDVERAPWPENTQGKLGHDI